MQLVRLSLSLKGLRRLQFSCSFTNVTLNAAWSGIISMQHEGRSQWFLVKVSFRNVHLDSDIGLCKTSEGSKKWWHCSGGSCRNSFNEHQVQDSFGNEAQVKTGTSGNCDILHRQLELVSHPPPLLHSQGSENNLSKPCFCMLSQHIVTSLKKTLQARKTKGLSIYDVATLK